MFSFLSAEQAVKAATERKVRMIRFFIISPFSVKLKKLMTMTKESGKPSAIACDPLWSGQLQCNSPVNILPSNLIVNS
jgi:hypothetical protein